MVSLRIDLPTREGEGDDYERPEHVPMVHLKARLKQINLPLIEHIGKKVGDEWFALCGANSPAMYEYKTPLDRITCKTCKRIHGKGSS